MKVVFKNLEFELGRRYCVDTDEPTKNGGVKRVFYDDVVVHGVLHGKLHVQKTLEPHESFVFPVEWITRVLGPI